MADTPAPIPASAGSLFIVFAEEYSGELTSGFGHLFVCFPGPETPGPEDLLLAPAVNFGVDTSPSGPGHFLGAFSVGPAFELVRQNSNMQQRTLMFFKLKVSPAEIKLLLEGMRDRVGIQYRYDFILKNCGFYMCDWLGAIRPEVRGDISPRLYLTPRQAVGILLNAFEVEYSLVQAPPALLVLERMGELALKGAPGGGGASDISRLEDAELKLALFSLAESRAGLLEFEEIRMARSVLLATPGGIEGARAALGREFRRHADASETWGDQEEGALVSFGLAGGGPHEEVSASLRLEPGLRDEFTKPVFPQVLREVHVLAVDLEFDGEARSTVTLVQYGVTRDCLGVLGGGSSGLSILHNQDRFSLLGLEGLSLDSWWGLASRFAGKAWCGFRLHGLGDRFVDAPRARIRPELFFSWVGEQMHFGASVVPFEEGDVAYRLISSRRMGGKLWIQAGVQGDADHDITYSLAFPHRF